MHHQNLFRLIKAGRLFLFLLGLCSLPAHAATHTATTDTTLVSIAAPTVAEPVILTDHLSQIRLEPHASYFCDPSGRLGLHEIRQQHFQKNLRPSLSLGYRSGACWFHYALGNQSGKTLDLILLINFSLLDDVQLFASDSNGVFARQEQRIWQTGDHLPFAQRPVATRNFTLPFSLSAGSQQDYFLRVSTSSSMTVPISVAERSFFIGNYSFDEWIHGLGFGLSLGLLLYHLFLWIAAREHIYRFYILYVASAFCYLLCLQGFAYRLWPDATVWNSHAHIFFELLTLSSGLLFTRDYLGISQNWTLGNRLLLALSASSAAGAVLLFVLPDTFVQRGHNLLAITSIAAVLFCGIRQWHQGMREARLYVIAWSLMVLMGLAFSLQAYGLIHLPTLLIVNGIALGLALQQTLLAFGLADRLNALKIEKQQQQEEILRARAESAAKTEFLAKMSHEIRTPMNALLGITQLLQDTPMDAEQKNYVDTLYSSGHALLNIINDILDYSRIASGKIELEMVDFNLLDLLDECIKVFSISARAKSLALICERSRDLPSHVRGDAGRLRQVLLNLLSNAIKFTDSGTVFLRASVEEMTETRVRLRFEVEDSGIGIAAEKIPRLFESFVQADSSTSREYGGSGLGLSISKELVELMHGQILASSQPGKGTVFRFNVLLKMAAAPALTTEPGQVPVSPAVFAGVQALVVEDNAINQLVIHGFLQKVGIKAHMASSGQEALDIIARGTERFDLVFMDCEMPLMDGFETTRRLREWERVQQRPPLHIIALTAHALAQHRQQCLQAGMDDYLSKPLLLSRLIEKLHAALS